MDDGHRQRPEPTHAVGVITLVRRVEFIEKYIVGNDVSAEEGP